MNEIDQAADPAATYIGATFGADGVFAKAFPGYQPREGQLELTRAVHKMFVQRENLLAEAPTGTGKSLAYGVPAAWWAAEHNPERSALKLKRQRTVIVTGNIALQEQLVEKDLPLLKRLLPWQFTFAIMKGRQNYLCLDRFNDLAVTRHDVYTDLEKRQLAQVEDWGKRTHLGDISELPFEMKEGVRRLVTIGQDDCLGSVCGYKETCYANLAKKEALSADVVVTNYHLFFIDLAIRTATEGEAGVLPPYDAVIFDEAHKAPDIAREFFGWRVTVGVIRKAVSLLWADETPKKPKVHIDGDLKREIVEDAVAFFGLLDSYERSDDYSARLREEEPVDYQAFCDLLRKGSLKLSNATQGHGFGAVRNKEIGRASEKLAACATFIESAMQLQYADKGHVYFLERGPGGKGVALVMKPLSVADELRPLIWKSPNISTAVAMSATMTTNGQDFDFIACDLGAEDANEFVAESPFDFRAQCELAVPLKIADPGNKGFAEDVAKHMLELAELAGGNMLGLFTSYRVLDLTHRLFIDRGWGDRVMKQGEKPRMQLIAQLKSQPGSVLLGTESFWAGVDVPGDALQVVAIDRLPFPTPDDPMLDAYQTIHGSKTTFKDYSIPRAVMQLRQGFGRLLRTTTDRGVVVVMDTRLVEKGYGKMFLRALPGDITMGRDVAGAVQRMVKRKAGV